MSERRTITRLLVANRGEIARRIFRTARAMGIQTVAVYADGDVDAPFVDDADDAVSLRGRTAADTYLDLDKVLAAAKRTGADAIHPGYGFLSENAAFARAVVDAGLTWVGPSPDAIAAMGDKLAAKRTMTAAGVPTLPSVEVGDDTDLAAAATEVGLPILVKASAGGGGKGMRVVDDASQLTDAVAAAAREAQAAFGDGTVFLERYVTTSRHVEIQVLADSHGNAVHCFERECSIQRRHQKVIEEAPSPAVDDELRARMGAAAVAAAKAVGYENAGTVEFLLSPDGEFFFLEMNTRLQVEHPVTEAITGLDLVREQLLVAQGHPLGFTQDDLAISGHAVEARLYAEDAAAGFLPATGTLHVWDPEVDSGVRFDDGVRSGGRIGIEFDPMLAKVIAHAPTRVEAAGLLASALERTRIHGVVTNRDFLVNCLRHPAFLDGDTTTDFIERHQPAPVREHAPDEVATAAVLAALWAQHRRRAGDRLLGSFPSGWRNSVMPPQSARYRAGDHEVAVEYQRRRDGSFDVSTGGAPSVARVVLADALGIDVELDGRRHRAWLHDDDLRVWVQGDAGEVVLDEIPRFPEADAEAVAGGLVAPMPGSIVSTHVAVGDTVTEGQLLVVMEAMKMEHRIVAPHAGGVTEVRVAVGDQVANGDLLVVVEEPAETSEG